MQVQSLSQEVPLEEGMATHSSILAWKIPWAEDPGGLQSMGCKELDMIEQLSTNIDIMKTMGMNSGCLEILIWITEDTSQIH